MDVHDAGNVSAAAPLPLCEVGLAIKTVRPSWAEGILAPKSWIEVASIVIAQHIAPSVPLASGTTQKAKPCGQRPPLPYSFTVAVARRVVRTELAAA